MLSTIFRLVFPDVFGISNLQLWTAFSVYGIVAMISYFIDGPLADRFSACSLLVLALLLTTLEGLVMAGITSLTVMTHHHLESLDNREPVLKPLARPGR